jgi:multiple sugar transport system permease protein
MKRHLTHTSPIELTVDALVGLFAILNLIPLYWMFSSTLKSSHQIVRMPPDWIPKNPSLKNYLDLFANGNAYRWIWNSILIAGMTTFLTVIVSSLAAYAFAKLRFWNRNAIYIIFISTLMIPKEVFIVSLFEITRDLGLLGTYTGVILPNVALPFGVFLLKGFCETIPDSIRESGKIDGAGEIKIFFKLMFPLMKAGIGALVVLLFVQIWNDYLWQMVMANKESMKTVQVAIAALQQENLPNIGYKLAGASLSAIPMLTVFIVFQKYFTSGITLGAIKE